MAIPTHPSATNEQSIIWALLLSFLLHATAAVLIPRIKIEESQLPDVLTVELQAPKQPEPVALPPTPEPQPVPEPPKPQPQPKQPPKPPKLQPQPKPRLETAGPVAELREIPQEPVVEMPPPAVIAAEPKLVAEPPKFTVPPPPPEPPPKQAGPTEDDINAARARYGSLLQREIAKHKQYPRIAQMRGWQGESVVEIAIDSSGNVLSSRIQTSSGYEALDNQALEMVKKASPFPAPPSVLQGRSFNVLVPVSFRLE